MAEKIIIPKISIVVPVYNAEEKLQRCLDDIVGQTFCDFECILVDDGSTDSSGQICDFYAQKDHRVRVIHKVNGGVSSARNTGKKAAYGQYLVFVDSDDSLRATYLEHMISEAEEHQADVVIAGHTLFLDGIQTPISTVTGTGSFASGSRNEIFTQALSEGLLNTCWGKLYRAEAVRACFFPEDLSWGEDTVFVLHCLRTDTVVRFAPWNEYLYYYIPSGLDGTFNTKKPIYLLRYYRELFDFTERMLPDSARWQRAVDIKVSQEILRTIFALSGQDVTPAQKKQYLGMLFSNKAVNRSFCRGVHHDDNPFTLKLLSRFPFAAPWLAFLALRDAK